MLSSAANHWYALHVLQKSLTSMLRKRMWNRKRGFIRTNSRKLEQYSSETHRSLAVFVLIRWIFSLHLILVVVISCTSRKIILVFFLLFYDKKISIETCHADKSTYNWLQIFCWRKNLTHEKGGFTRISPYKLAISWLNIFQMLMTCAGCEGWFILAQDGKNGSRILSYVSYIMLYGSVFAR